MKSGIKETFGQSVFALMVSQVIVKVLGLFHRLYLTNREGYGDEGNAIANGGFQVFALMLSVIAIGIPTAISKLVSERLACKNYKGAHRVFQVAIIIFAIIGTLGSLTLYSFSIHLSTHYLHMPESQLSILALCPSIILVSLISVFKGYFSGRKSVKITGRAQTFDQLIKTLSTIIMIELSILGLKKTNTAVLSAISNLAVTLGNFAELAYLYYGYKKELPVIKYEISNNKYRENASTIKIIKQIFIIAIPLSLTAIITTISKNIDSSSIVGELKELIGYEEAKRQYGILSGKVDALINFPLSFNMAIVTALLPSIATTNGKIESKEGIINQSILLGLSIALPITSIFWGFSDELLQILFPNASSGGNILRISSLSVVFITLEQLSNIVLNGIGKNTIPIKAITTGVIVKALLNKVLVRRIELPIGGTAGAAIATLACHIVASMISIYMMLKYSSIKIKITNIIKLIVASLIMLVTSKGVFSWLENTIDLKISLLFSILIGGIVFCGLANKVVHIKTFKIKKTTTSL